MLTLRHSPLAHPLFRALLQRQLHAASACDSSFDFSPRDRQRSTHVAAHSAHFSTAEVHCLAREHATLGETVLTVKLPRRRHVDDCCDLLAGIGLEGDAVHGDATDVAQRQQSLGEIDGVGNALISVTRHGYDDDEFRAGVLRPVEQFVNHLLRAREQKIQLVGQQYEDFR